jgi:hypothetical protein
MTQQYLRAKGITPLHFDGLSSATIWRYQDLTKLLALLTSGCLWFTRADCLGDPYEGSSTKATQAWRAATVADLPNAQESLSLSSWLDRAWVRNTAVNCWHMSEYESEAMWKLYVTGGQGVTIRSTVERFMAAFPAFPEDLTVGNTATMVHFGAIRYIDHHHDPVTLEGMLTQPFFFKRRSFEHEREFRAVILDMPTRHEDLKGTRFPDRGIAVPIKVSTLIEAVYLPPFAPTWFKSVVAHFAAQFQIPVRTSQLDENPIF